MKVHALPVPTRESMNREGVAEVAWARAHTACRWFEAGSAIQTAQCAPGRGLRKAAAGRADENVIVGLRAKADELAPRSEVSSQLDGEGAAERGPPRPAFRLGDEQDVTTKIDIADPEAQRLAETQARAVEDKKKRTVK